MVDDGGSRGIGFEAQKPWKTHTTLLWISWGTPPIDTAWVGHFFLGGGTLQ